MKSAKIIWLSALAALAIGAVGASAANAAEGTAVVSAGTTNFSATQTGSGTTLTLVGGRVLSCSTVTYSGSITNGAKELQATPTFDGCKLKVGASTLPVTIECTGACRFKVRTWTRAGVHYTTVILFQGTLHIKAYATEANHTSNTRLCEYEIQEQSGLTGGSLTDNLNGTLDLTYTEVAIAVKRTFGTAGNCGEASFNATLNGNNLITAASGTLGIDE
jgi:hypothetical protein